MNNYSQKSYESKNALYLIPTPIGNLQDITMRSIEILKLVDVVFSEDTRVTGMLLKHLDIKKKMISSHNYNEEKTKLEVVKYLEEGKNVGLVSDRGTPIISDPGYKVVEEVVKNGYSVISLPGATAFVPAITSSGINSDRFMFYGFLDSKNTKRESELKELIDFPYTIVFYESPHRLIDTLESIKNVLGNRQISISREITKLYEEIIRGPINEVITEIKEVKGEFVIVVEGNKKDKTYDHLTIIEHVNLYIREGIDSKEAIKKVSKDRKIPKSEVYNFYHKEKGDL